MKKFTNELRSPISSIFKKMVVCFAVLILFPTAYQSQTVFSIVGIANGFNTNTGYPSPYGNWYWGARHQMYVTPTELVAAGMSPGVNVKSVGFNIQSLNSGPPHQNWIVTIFTVTAANPLGANFFTGVPVAQSTITTATGVLGWNQYTVNPFIWNGTDALIVETCFFNGSYIQNYSTFWTGNLTGADVKTRAYWQDGVTSCPNSPGSTWTNTRPDMRFEWEYLTPCSGVPGANSINTPTFQICPNVAYGGIGLANSYTVGGLNYQWLQSTTSNVGPFAPVPSGGSGWTYNVPSLTVTTWYQAVITCTNSMQSFTTLGSPILVAAPTTSTVPYYENFEGIGQPGRLPNCSWFAANQNTTVKTYTSAQTGNRVPNSGSSFGTYELPSANNAVYSNGIQMNIGITYSAAIFYATEYFGYGNWNKLELLVGPNQNATGLIPVAQVSPAISGPYKLLDGLFTVPTSGTYYVCIRATGSAGNALYLSFDDLSVTIPCTALSGNNPTISLSASNTTICANDQVNLNANGGTSYLWSTGATGPNITVSPLVTTPYSVVGTNVLTGCSQTVTQLITVNPSPTVFIVASKSSICPGETVFLTGYGASNFAWSNTNLGTVITVNPLTTTTYSVVGTNAFGCSGSGSHMITVKPAPVISAISSNLGDICANDAVTLTGSGGVSYSWICNTNNSIFGGNPLVIVPSVTSIYTVTGVGANGCSNKATLTQNVVPCVGLENNSINLKGLMVYPNPAQTVFTVEYAAGFNSVQVTDVAGREVLKIESSSSKLNIDISTLAKGIYYAKINADSGSEIVKVVKQ